MISYIVSGQLSKLGPYQIIKQSKIIWPAPCRKVQPPSPATGRPDLNQLIKLVRLVCHLDNCVISWLDVTVKATDVATQNQSSKKNMWQGKCRFNNYLIRVHLARLILTFTVDWKHMINDWLSSNGFLMDLSILRWSKENPSIVPYSAGKISLPYNYKWTAYVLI
jgi:hypothetical protein